MSIDKISIDELSIMQLCDSFFPTGMYTMSNGLEAIFYNDKKVNGAKGLRDLIRVYVEHQIGPARMPLSATLMDMQRTRISKNCWKWMRPCFR